MNPYNHDNTYRPQIMHIPLNLPGDNASVLDYWPNTQKHIDVSIKWCEVYKLVQVGCQSLSVVIMVYNDLNFHHTLRTLYHHTSQCLIAKILCAQCHHTSFLFLALSVSLRPLPPPPPPPLSLSLSLGSVMWGMGSGNREGGTIVFTTCSPTNMYIFLSGQLTRM